ncbi:MAG: hypothetical protein WDO73_29470 [Ignavibacteriota bacterium]
MCGQAAASKLVANIGEPIRDMRDLQSNGRADSCSYPALPHLLQQVGNRERVQIVIERFQNFVLERRLSVLVPFLLERLFYVTTVPQREPATVLRRVQIPRGANPDLAIHRAAHTRKLPPAASAP